MRSLLIVVTALSLLLSVPLAVSAMDPVPDVTVRVCTGQPALDGPSCTDDTPCVHASAPHIRTEPVCPLEQ